ncbi:acid protease, partial [Aspergillus indologenus CBS 114.80]
LSSVYYGQGLVANVTLGDQEFALILDTGSSDTWVVGTGFICADPSTLSEIDEDGCGFGATYDSKQSLTARSVPNENFRIHYGSGAFVEGRFEYEQVTVGDIQVSSQQVAVVEYSAWFGDNSSSGILGLAYPALTFAYPGTNFSADRQANRLNYNPIFTTMYEIGLVSPLFSLAVSRDADSAGYLAFGGLPPGTPKAANFVSTPIQTLTTYFPGYNYTGYAFYTVTVDEATSPWRNVGNITGFQMIVDSGTTLLDVPNQVADSINAQFDPPATYSADLGAYAVACNATPPAIGIRIAGRVFPISPQDMIFKYGQETCFSGVNRAGASLTVLGIVFLRNVVAVFDVGNTLMRFTSTANF